MDTSKGAGVSKCDRIVSEQDSQNEDAEDEGWIGGRRSNSMRITRDFFGVHPSGVQQRANDRSRGSP